MIMKFYYGRVELDVPERVYYPREDSELLAKVIDSLDLKGKAVLETGCGSGFLSILMAKKCADVTAVDINTEAVEITGKNAAANGAKINTFISDLFSAVGGTFDIIVFNPPYLPVEEGENDTTY